MLRNSLFGAGLAAGVFSVGFAMSSAAGIPGGTAIVFVAHITPAADSLSLPDPRSPDDCVSAVAGRGDYDVWYYLFSREPLAGAWTVDVGLAFDRHVGHGIDLLGWEPLADRSSASSGWPGEGSGIRIEWNRPDGFDPTHADLFHGEGGWFRQAALRLRVRVHGPDSIGLADCEPGVPSQVVSCYDDAFRLDGEDGWTSYRGASFGDAGAEGAVSGSATPTLPVTWSVLKSRGIDGGRP